MRSRRTTLWAGTHRPRRVSANPRWSRRPARAPWPAARRAPAAPPPPTTPGVVPAARQRASAGPRARHPSRRAPTRCPRALPVAQPSFPPSLPSSRPRVGLLLVLLMPVPGHMVAVLGLLIGSELARDLGVHLRPHRVEARAHRFPHGGHPRPVALHDRPHGVALRGAEAQLVVQLFHHSIEPAPALGRRSC